MSEHFRKKLVDFIDTKLKDSGKSITENYDDNSPLITSGLLESMQLVKLALLVEEEVNYPLDTTTTDLTTELDTINAT